MDALTAIHTRRSIRSWTDEPVPEEVIQQILEAAYDASSGANRQPREYVVVTDREAIAKIAEIHVPGKWLSGAPAAIVLLADPSKGRYWLEDSCVAAQNMWIAATALGYGMAWSAQYQSDNAEESARREGLVREILNIPAGLRVIAVFGLGKPAAPPREQTRPPLAEMVHWGAYGARRLNT